MAKPFLTGLRSGRFNVKSVPAAGIVIVHKVRGQVYRILNAGEKLFKVPRTPSDADPIKIYPRQSADVAFPASTASVKILPENANDDLRGIYDILPATDLKFPSTDVRSGRFSLDQTGTPPIDPTTKIPIIDLTNYSSPLAYRLLNSGKYAIQLRTDPTAADPIFSLDKDRSIDFLVEANSTLYVSSAEAAKPISGIFELIAAKP